jgi:hypothetical protein
MITVVPPGFWVQMEPQFSMLMVMVFSMMTTTSV